MDDSTDSYAFMAGWYERVFGPVLRGLRTAGLDLCPPAPGWNVLDVGCGTGAQLELYQRRGCVVAGIEPSRSMAAAARARLGPRASIEEVDAARLPHAAASFDLVLASMMLHELRAGTRTAIVRDVARVLRPGGRLLVIDYHPGPLRFPRGYWVRPLVLAAERLAGHEHYHNHLAFLAGGGLPALARSHGFAMDRSRVVKGGTFGVYLLALSAR